MNDLLFIIDEIKSPYLDYYVSKCNYYKDCTSQLLLNNFIRRKQYANFQRLWLHISNWFTMRIKIIFVGVKTLLLRLIEKFVSLNNNRVYNFECAYHFGFISYYVTTLTSSFVRNSNFFFQINMFIERCSISFKYFSTS